MLINKKSNYRSFWKEADVHVKNIPEEIFMAIYQSFFNLSEKVIDEIASNLNKNFSKYYIPRRQLSIDELLSRFKEKTKHKCYDPSKPAKYGLKFYFLVDKSGYLYSFIFHKSGIQLNVKDICLELLKDIKTDLGKYILYADNYSTFNLINELNNNYYFIFTHRKNRNLNLLADFHDKLGKVESIEKLHFLLIIILCLFVGKIKGNNQQILLQIY